MDALKTSEVRILNTTEQDLDLVYWLFEEAISYQKKNGYTAWKGYDKDALRAEMGNQFQYKVVNGADILGVFSISYNDSGTWGEWDTGNAVFLHRTITNPNFKGQRTFEKIRNWAIRFAKENKLTYIRMDTWADNQKIIDFYQDYGFKVVTTRTTSNGPELPQQNRNLNVTLLEMKVE